MTDTHTARSRTVPMAHLRSALFALGCSLLPCAASLAQAGSDAESRAVAAAERTLDGRTVARRTVAVLPFTVTSPDTTLEVLGYGIAEFLSDDLAHSHRLVMVERSRLADLQRESNLSLTDNIDPATRVRAGRLLAAQHMIFGAIEAPEADVLSIDERAVNVESGTVEMHRHASTSIDAIFRAERDLAMDTFSMFGITLTPDEKRALYERVAPEFRAFVVFSRGVRAEQQGDDEAAMASFQDAAALDKSFKLASNKLAAARQRIAARISTTTSAAAVKDDATSKTTPKDPHESAPSLAGGSAPTGTLSSSGNAPTGTASSTTSPKKTDPSPGKKRNTRTVHANPRSPVP